MSEERDELRVATAEFRAAPLDAGPDWLAAQVDAAAVVRGVPAHAMMELRVEGSGEERVFHVLWSWEDEA